MKIPLYQVDAFTSKVFAGNPAAVCPLEAWLPDEQLQAIALENNLSETAYFVPNENGFNLRWFTPAVEVDLCGHATLASAFVLMTELEPSRNEVRFMTRSGELIVTREGDRFAMDFPARPPKPCTMHPELFKALGGPDPEMILGARDYLVVYRSESEVAALKPNMEVLTQIDRFAVIVTAPGDQVDFVSRFFAPAKGVPEDPVTGSAHCTLIPYWSERLGKKSLRARQISRRGGDLWCEDRGERVRIAGNAALFLTGSIEV
ncbi:MAG TPA: PhzF family phenazine biosynthesis protein [Bryobacteraceae bacterium]|nr:PhzF family phenazine biosynthesis protein [Bryobacteraceae bacterium]